MPEMAVATTKYMMIADKIRGQVLRREILPDSPIPSYQALIKEHGVTIGTVRKALMVLQSENLVETVPGIGCVVKERKQKWVTLGACFTTERPRVLGLWAEQFAELQARFAELKFDVTVHFLPTLSEESIGSFLEWARRQDGVLLRGRIPVRAIKAALDAGVTTVLSGEALDGECPEGAGQVTVDIPSIARLAVSHLVSLGHRRIGFFNGAGSHYFDLVSQAFRESLAEYGQVAQAMELRNAGDRVESAGEVVKWLAQLPSPPTALIVEGGDVATATVECLNNNSWPVPGRISVLGISAVSGPPHMAKGITCVLNPAREIALHAAEMLAKMAQGKPVARVERVVTRYVEGATCRAI